MGVPVTEFAAVMQALSNHGVKYMKNEDINAMLRAMSPMFKPGYQESIERESTNQIRSLIERWEKAIAGDSGDEELDAGQAMADFLRGLLPPEKKVDTDVE